MTTDEGRELLCNIQGPIAARSSQFRKQGSLPAALRTSYQFFGDLLARFAVLSTACRKWPGHRHPPVLRIAKYPGDWERGNLTKCESKFASPQSSPSKSCNDLSRTAPCSESLLILAADQRRCENNKRKAHFGIRLVNGLPGMVAFMMLVPGSGQGWKTAFKTPMIASGGTANELHG